MTDKNSKKQGAKLMAASAASASRSGLYADPREDWLAQLTEDIIDPARPTVHPQPHPWDRRGLHYLIQEMARDLASVHNILPPRYVHCRPASPPPGPHTLHPAL